mmetsp:Transcript_29972/g.93821  ORF Transcript_29972/g.93821 Transcript_29972/m.93821 type:complete len:241 (+) Transcript_29972:3-725(+)
MRQFASARAAAGRAAPIPPPTALQSGAAATTVVARRGRRRQQRRTAGSSSSRPSRQPAATTPLVQARPTSARLGTTTTSGLHSSILSLPQAQTTAASTQAGPSASSRPRKGRPGARQRLSWPTQRRKAGAQIRKQESRRPQGLRPSALQAPLARPRQMMTSGSHIQQRCARQSSSRQTQRPSPPSTLGSSYSLQAQASHLEAEQAARHCRVRTRSWPLTSPRHARQRAGPAEGRVASMHS